MATLDTRAAWIKSKVVLTLGISEDLFENIGGGEEGELSLDDLTCVCCNV